MRKSETISLGREGPDSDGRHGVVHPEPPTATPRCPDHLGLWSMSLPREVEVVRQAPVCWPISS